MLLSIANVLMFIAGFMILLLLTAPLLEPKRLQKYLNVGRIWNKPFYYAGTYLNSKKNNHFHRFLIAPFVVSICVFCALTILESMIFHLFQIHP